MSDASFSTTELPQTPRCLAANDHSSQVPIELNEFSVNGQRCLDLRQPYTRFDVREQSTIPAGRYSRRPYEL
jgi:hypothetical protein